MEGQYSWDPRWCPGPQPSTASTSLDSTVAHPIVCRAHFPEDIVSQLVSWGNSEVQVINNYLELEVSVIHHACMADCFSIRNHIMLSRTDNTAGLWWQRKGSATSTLPPAHLLRFQAVHQRFRLYVPRHDFFSRVDNCISNRPSCSQDLMDTTLIVHIDASHPQELPWRLWKNPSEVVSVISYALRLTTSPRYSLLVDTLSLMGIGQSGPSSVKMWPSNPYLYHIRIQCLSSTPSRGST